MTRTRGAGGDKAPHLGPGMDDEGNSVTLCASVESHTLSGASFLHTRCSDSLAILLPALTQEPGYSSASAIPAQPLLHQRSELRRKIAVSRFIEMAIEREKQGFTRAALPKLS
jgi:hypothetical protein